jgi:hypothetical protein
MNLPKQRSSKKQHLSGRCTTTSLGQNTNHRDPEEEAQQQDGDPQEARWPGHHGSPRRSVRQPLRHGDSEDHPGEEVCAGEGEG